MVLNVSGASINKKGESMKKMKTSTIIIILVLGYFALSYTGFLGGVAPKGTSVTRSISPSQPAPGDTITVTLTVNPGTGVKAVLIHDEAPFTIMGASGSVYETAIIDTVQVSPTTKTYRMTAGSIGAYSFSGKFTEDGGSDNTIDGVTSFQVQECTPSCVRPGNMCIEASTVSDGCGGNCAGAWTVTKNTKADTDCDNSVSWSEINSATSSWLSGGYSWAEINQAISAWLGG